jgi:serine/threonine-protein kinase
MATDLLGTEILGYRIVEFVAEGGMASVWKAKHIALDERYRAVKVLDPLLARDPSLVERFEREARTQARLEHPNIVAIENYAFDHLAILMEWIDGRSLDVLLRAAGGALPLDRAVRLMRQVLTALQFAHSRGVVHRDIKPGNVLVTWEDRVKLADFGIVRIMGGARNTQAGSFVGTAMYVSPEQVRGVDEADGRSDLYSLGVTLFELLAGRPPFEGEPGAASDFALRLAHVQSQPPDPREFQPKIPALVAAVVMKALEKDPAARYATADEMLQALETAARSSGQDPAARPAPAGPAAPRPSAARPPASAGVARPAAPSAAGGVRPAPVAAGGARPAAPVAPSGVRPAAPAAVGGARPAAPVAPSGVRPAAPAAVGGARPSAPGGVRPAAPAAVGGARPAAPAPVRTAASAPAGGPRPGTPVARTSAAAAWKDDDVTGAMDAPARAAASRLVPPIDDELERTVGVALPRDLATDESIAATRAVLAPSKVRAAPATGPHQTGLSGTLLRPAPATGAHQTGLSGTLLRPAPAAPRPAVQDATVEATRMFGGSGPAVPGARAVGSERPAGLAGTAAVSGLTGTAAASGPPRPAAHPAPPGPAPEWADAAAGEVPPIAIEAPAAPAVPDGSGADPEPAPEPESPEATPLPPGEAVMSRTKSFDPRNPPRRSDVGSAPGGPGDTVAFGHEPAAPASSPGQPEENEFPPGFEQAYAPNAYAPDAYAPDAYAPDAYAEDAYAEDAYAEDAYAEDAYAEDAYAEDEHAGYGYDEQAYAQGYARGYAQEYGPDPNHGLYVTLSIVVSVLLVVGMGVLIFLLFKLKQ